MTGQFYIVYVLCGASDILDGFLARKFNVASRLGATLDSIADFVFVVIMLILFIPIIDWDTWIIIWVILIAFVRLLSLAVGVIKFHAVAFLHTYTNKATGVILFLVPILYKFEDFQITAVIVCSIASLSALEELLIFLKSKHLNRDVHSIFSKNKLSRIY